MKKISLLILCCAFMGMAHAQLANGSYAPDFSLYEIDKTTGNILTTDTFTLYEYTDAGKAVFLDFFATWCSPCYSYHQSGAFENLYTTYGPNGTNEVMVMGIEASNGNYNSLSGAGADANGSPTQGNWLTGVQYPILPTAMSPNTTSSISTDYSIGYFPTIYMVCPNRLVYEVSQQTTANLYAAIASTCPSFQAGLMNNALLVNGSGIDGSYLCAATATPSILLQNVGELNLTSATFNITLDGQASTYTWTGTLGKYEAATVTLPQITANTNGSHSYSVSIDQVNGVADADTAYGSFSQDFNVQLVGTTEPIDEDFSDESFWDTWSMANDLLGVYSNNGALFFYAWGLSSGVTEDLFLPLLDLTGINTPTLKFDLAHARYSSSTVERLRVRVSTDCGANWENAYNKADPDLATAGVCSSGEFIPTASQWRTETVDLSAYKTAKTIVKFAFTSGYGNIVWIDNVRIVDGTGIEENTDNFNIYPNPATSVLNIQSDATVEKVEVYNLQGQLVRLENGNVQSVNVSSLSAGTYILRVSTVNGILNQRFVKE